jgi:hypothetical protein
MRARVEPLLAELHAHTTWSDGVMTPRELIDLYGRQGFDVLCVTDHVVRTDDPWCDRGGTAFGVAEREYPRFAAELAAEADRALALYGLVVVVPGLELTYNDLDPAAAAHAVAVGLRTFVSVDDGIAGALEKAELVHRFELFNRSQPFSWVAQAGHPAVAAGDTHLPEHLYGWKTLIPCARNERAIVDYLRSRRPVYLTHLERGRRLIAA